MSFTMFNLKPGQEVKIRILDDIKSRGTGLFYLNPDKAKMRFDQLPREQRQAPNAHEQGMNACLLHNFPTTEMSTLKVDVYYPKRLVGRPPAVRRAYDALPKSYPAALQVKGKLLAKLREVIGNG